MAFVTGATNRRISASLPERYLAEILEEQGEDVLKAHCIPLDPALWRLNAFPQFLEYRRAALAQAINELIAQSGTSAVTVRAADLIARGESEEVEFKASARYDYMQGRHNPALEAVVPKTLAAFLNSKGGTMIIGVDDSGRILGLEREYSTLTKRPDQDGYQQFLVNLISTSTGKEVFTDLTVSFEDADGKEVCIIRAKASLRPVYVKEGGQTTFYVRTGNVTQGLGVKEAMEYIKTRWKA